MIDKCVFCGLKRKGENPTGKDWISDIYIVSTKGDLVYEKMSVCPKCRQRKIVDLYGATQKKGMKEYNPKHMLKMMTWKV